MHERAFIAIAKALADPTRRRMVRALQRRGAQTCTCLCDLFPLSQPTISHHVRTLEQAGIVRVRKEGQFHRLTLDEGVLAAFAADLTRGGPAAPTRAPRARSSGGRVRAGEGATGPRAAE